MQPTTMFKFEQVKLFMAGDIEKLQDAFNLWIRQETGNRKKNIPALEHESMKIIDRTMCVRNYDGEETYVLSIFYEHYDVKPFAQGPDRGGQFKGGSAFGPK